MFFWRKKPKNDDLFAIQDMDNVEAVARSKEDDFFEEAFASYPHSAHEPNKSFVGSVIQGSRFTVFTVCCLAVFCIFVGKASALQLVNGAEYRNQAENNRIRYKTLPAKRGVIYDRNGIVLAENQPAFQITSSKEQLPPDGEERNELIESLAEFLDTDSHKIFEAIDTAETYDEQILIAEKLDYETALRFAARSSEYASFALESSSLRSYITNEIPTLSHVLGYTGVINEFEYEEKKDENYRRFDNIGKHGIEQQYERMLRGTFGEEMIEVDALGNTERIVSKRDPVDGESIYLSIDSELQAFTEDVLAARMEGTAASRASVIVMNPKNGEVYSLISWPTFDSNDFAGGIDQTTYEALINNENLPLFPRATSGEFPSGSTIKPVFAAAALNEGIITPSTSFLSVGGIAIGVWYFPDWRAGGHGSTNVYHAIADSVNTFFYIIGGGYDQFDGLGIERLMEYASRFGFGKTTNIDLPGEATGFLPSKDWKYETKNEVWYIGDTYHAAIGQGDFLSTPLQIAQSTAIFANDGVRVSPHINMYKEPEMEEVVSPEIAKIIQDAMRQTVTAGSARSLQSVPVAVAGKTGTAQWASNRPNHAWFTGFAPYEDPEIVVTVLVEEGADASLAVPVAREIFTWWFSDR